MALKDLVTNLGDFYKDNPYQAKYKTKAGPAIALKQGFNQRSLPFGDDRPDGGNSGQPFIVKKLPEVNSDPLVESPDFILRRPEEFLDTRKDDFIRIGKFLKSTEGILFIAKQELLSLMNPPVPGRPNRSKPFNGLYNPAMTLLQVTGQGTGLHIEKQGLLPIYDNQSKFETVYKNEYSSESTNKLTLLYKSKIKSDFEYGLSAAEAKTAISLGISTNPNTVLSYIGGAANTIYGKTVIPVADNSAYSETTIAKQKDATKAAGDKVKVTALNYNKHLGVTNTGLQLGYFVNGQSITTGSVFYRDWNESNNRINPDGKKTYDNTVYLSGNTFPETNPAVTNQLNVFVFRQTDYQSANLKVFGRQGSGNVQDFRRVVAQDKTQVSPNGTAEQLLYYTDYTSPTINREQRVGLGTPGKKTRNRKNLSSYDNDTVDKVNMVPLYYDDIVLDPYGVTRDMVKFRFEVIDNKNPTFSTYVHFRAFLGAIRDDYRASWESTKFVGRGEKFYTYNGFDRGISFGFQVSAQSRAEMRSIYQKLNYLATSLAPDYTNGYMKGNLVRLTIGDYLSIVPGFITSLNYSIPENASWEIGLTQPEKGVDTGVLESPMFIEVSVEFTPIHDFVPRLSADKENALITPSKMRNGYLDDNPIRDFNNNYNKETGQFTFNNVANNQQKDYISKQNMIKYATLGSVAVTANDVIKVADNAVGQKTVNDVAPTGQGGVFNTTTASPSTFGF